MTVQDSIRREMVLKASRDKVWDALTRPDLLTKWFSHQMDVESLSVGTEFRFDWRPEYGYSRAIVEVMDPKSHFAYRWENDSEDQSIPFADVPTTLVSFSLEAIPEGTRLTVVESGITQMHRPAKVFSENSQGWDSELAELKTYVENT